MAKHFVVEQPEHDPRTKESIFALKKLEFESRDMNLGIEALLKIENEMLQHLWFLAETEISYLRSWELAEGERKARYSELFLVEKKEKKKTDAITKEATNLLIKKEIYDEIHAKWKFRSVKKVYEVASDTVYAIKDRLKSSRKERNEGGGSQP